MDSLKDIIEVPRKFDGFTFRQKGSAHICSIKNNTKYFRKSTDFQVHKDNRSAVKIYESYNIMHKDRFNI